MSKRAIIYLRVSTTAQTTRGRDAEGFSIPAQRDACTKKATQLDADVVDEYVDAGESAKSADRPQLLALLERLDQADHNIDYVIVHKLDRLARNRADDIEITVALRTAGAQLVSVTENIDETLSGVLLHGIMASIAEFYSANLATEVIKGSVKKAESGGTLGRAPLGYLNVRERLDGHDIRTIAVDPERGRLMAWAFEAYATGDYSLRELVEQLDEQGLRTRGTKRWPSQPLSRSNLAKLLRNTYYIGIVTYRGQQYRGSHEPLVDPDTFELVRDVLDSKFQAGERRNLRHHYLKGTIYCGRCESRMAFTRVKGNGGHYDYFFCLGRQRKNGCDLPWLKPEQVERMVEDHWSRVELPTDRLDRLRDGLLNELAKTIEREKEGLPV